MNTLPPAIPSAPKAAAAPKLMPGAGTRLTANSVGTALNAPSSGPRIALAFKPSLSAAGIRFSRGYVADRMPTIQGVPIVPRDGRPQPALPLDFGIANEFGESWVCVEVHPDEKGELPPKSAIEIVHRRQPRALSKILGRAPLCLIVWREKKPVQVHQIVHFNLGYVRVLPPDGAGAVRHPFP